MTTVLMPVGIAAMIAIALALFIAIVTAIVVTVGFAVFIAVALVARRIMVMAVPGPALPMGRVRDQHRRQEQGSQT